MSRQRAVELLFGVARRLCAEVGADATQTDLVPLVIPAQRPSALFVKATLLGSRARRK